MTKNRENNLCMSHANLLNRLCQTYKISLKETILDHRVTVTFDIQGHQSPLTNKTKWLLHINFIIKVIMEINIYDVQMINRLIANNNQRQKEADFFYFSNRRENIIVIKSKYLYSLVTKWAEKVTESDWQVAG